MTPFLRLIRYKNLLIMAFAMCMMTFAVIHPLLQLFNLQPTFTNLDLAFLILAVVLIAAGGYVINDYFDTAVDMVNRPDTQIVSNVISRSSAATYHITLSILGCILGFMVSIRIGIWKVGFMYPIIVGLLWFYSSTYKKQFLIGNIVVSVLTGLVMVLPALYEIPGLQNCQDPVIQYGALDPFLLLYQCLGFAIFAFLSNFAREIIKDMEDIKGDKTLNARTLAIVLGEKGAKITVISILAITVAALVYCYLNFLNEPITAIYFSVALIAPLIFLTYRFIKAKEKKDYHFCSIFLKFIMLLGVLYAFVIRYNFLTFKDSY